MAKKKDKPGIVDRAREALNIDEQPDYLGRTERDHAHGARITSDQGELEVKTQFDDTLYFGDPTKDIPEEMGGVVQIKTSSEVAAEEAYAKALKDPTSVLAPREVGDRVTDSMTDVEIRAHRRRMKEAFEAGEVRTGQVMSRMAAMQGSGEVTRGPDGGIVISGNPDAYPDLSQVTGSLDEEIARARAFQDRLASPKGVETSRAPSAAEQAADLEERRAALKRFEDEQG